MTEMILRDRNNLISQPHLNKNQISLFRNIAQRYLILPQSHDALWDTVHEIFFITGEFDFYGNQIENIVDDENLDILDACLEIYDNDDPVRDAMRQYYIKEYRPQLFSEIERILSSCSHLWSTEDSWIQSGQVCLFEELI